MPNLESLTPHERAALERAAAQVDSILGRHWPVAQLVERRTVNADVARSSRARSASFELV